MRKDQVESAALDAGVFLMNRFGGPLDVAVIFGSGLSVAADILGETLAEVATGEVPNFLAPTVDGHLGTIRSLQSGRFRVLSILGRTHLYEDHGPYQATLAVRAAKAAGCRAIVLTSAVGMLVPKWTISTPVLVGDHIDWFDESPCVSGFPNLSGLYSDRFRRRCREVDPALDEAVLVQIRGPQLETDAEVRMMRLFGGGIVGMSVAIEAIVAREVGLEVGGISVVTDDCGPGAVHGNILEAAKQAAPRIGRVLAHAIQVF